MSVTTTTTQPNTFSVLSDYELHHSGTESPQPPQVPQPQPQLQPQPENWPSNHRRIPPFRPINRQLDRSQRPAGSNAPEFVFIQAMLHGVWLNAVSLPVYCI